MPISAAVSLPHAADEAGGEVIFSSDGLDPLPAPAPPPPVGAAAAREDEEGDLYAVSEDDPLVDLEHAWQLFGLRRASRTPEERLQELELELHRVAKDLATEDALHSDVARLRTRLERQLETLQKPPAGTNTGELESESQVVAKDVELLLQRLERAVGSSSVTQRVTQLEQLMEQLDERRLDMTARQAKVLRNDLQAASKARSKLAPLAASAAAPASSTGSSNYHSDDAKTISQLYNTMIELETVREHLPVLTQRLQALAHLHTNASTTSQRLAACEASLQSLQTHVASIEQSLVLVRSEWQNGAEAAMVKNLEALDERLAKLR